MYNTQINVKYHDIKQELLAKQSSQDIYTVEDITIICEKLYRDELLLVFNAENIMDDNIDICIKQVFTNLMLYSSFKQTFDEIVETVFNKDFDSENQKEGIANMCVFILFSEDVFYITHKCICQLTNTGEINDEFLEQLKQKFKK